MVINFPTSPYLNEIYSYNNLSWKWNGSAWVVYTAPTLDIFVTGGTYTNGEVLFINNSGGTFTVTGLPIGGAGGQVYYFNQSNTQTPYKEFSSIGTNAIEQSQTLLLNSGTTGTISSFLTPSGYPNTTLIAAGYWTFYLHTYKSGTTSFDIYCDVYKRSSSGFETFLFSTDPTSVNSNYPNTSMDITDGYYSGSSINSTDRILVKILGTNTSNQNGSITLLTEGTQHYSYGITPFSSNGSLTCENLSGCTTIVKLESGKVSKSGDTMSGGLISPSISATTISAKTYQGITSENVTTALGYIPKPQNRTTFNNADKTMSSTDVYLAQIGNMTVPRTVYLPSANSVSSGYEIIVADESGSVTSTNTIIISKSLGSSDTIASGNSITIAAAYGMRRFFSDGISKWSYDAGVLRASNNLSDVTNPSIALANLKGMPIEANSTTGVTLTFLTDTIYGSIATPETGNISFNTTGALLGVTNIIIHNNTSITPSFATNMKKLSGSSSYVVNTINYIYITYINPTEIIYSINQRT